VFYWCGTSSEFLIHKQHVVASREHTPDKVTFTSAAYNQLRLNKLDPEIFPIPKHTLSPKRELSGIMIPL
jgi:ribonuclease Z